MTTILLVEDDDNQRMLYTQELEAEGYAVLSANGGAQALEKFAETRPDIIVMDISMPDIDGIETMNMIHEKDQTIPVIFNTAYSNYKDNFQTWSADAYVVKTSNTDKLKKTIIEVLEKDPTTH